jgi:class 3 adenylate cyclase
MALDMQERVTGLSARWRDHGLLEASFQIRIGINSGVASVGNFGSKERMDYTAIGRQVNIAARLQVYCEPGKILLSHATWVLVKDRVACTEKGEIPVKGMERPVKVYEVSPRTTFADALEQEASERGGHPRRARSRRSDRRGDVCARRRVQGANAPSTVARASA